jgi:hypothetical protein
VLSLSFLEFDPQATFERLPSSIDKIARIAPHPSEESKIVALLQHFLFFQAFAKSA